MVHQICFKSLFEHATCRYSFPSLPLQTREQQLVQGYGYPAHSTVKRDNGRHPTAAATLPSPSTTPISFRRSVSSPISMPGSPRTGPSPPQAAHVNVSICVRARASVSGCLCVCMPVILWLGVCLFGIFVIWSRLVHKTHAGVFGSSARKQMCPISDRHLRHA